MPAMHKYSREMPPAPDQHCGIVGWAILLALAGGLLYLLYLFPTIVLSILGVFAVLGSISANNRRRHLGRLAAGRQGESTCTFARSFDYRNMDMWILRAVYEELQSWCKIGSQDFPLRATDRLDDLRVDLEIFEDSSLEKIAHRTGRSLDNTDQNPLFGKIVTVNDLVMFFSYQRKTRIDPRWLKPWGRRAEPRDKPSQQAGLCLPPYDIASNPDDASSESLS
jgi:hypothetical protein